MVQAGVVETRKEMTFSERIKAVMQRLDELLQLFKPDEVSLEEIFFSKNAKTAIKVAEMRGVILALLVSRGFAVYEYTPREVKQAFTGTGNADKKQIQKMVKLIFGKEIKPDDAADAVAIAWCHMQRRQFERLIP